MTVWRLSALGIAVIAGGYLLYHFGFLSPGMPDADLSKLKEGTYSLRSDDHAKSAEKSDSRFAEVSLRRDQSRWVMQIEKARCLIDTAGNFECDKGYDTRGHLFGDNGSLTVQLSPGSTYFTNAPKSALYYNLTDKPAPETISEPKPEAIKNLPINSGSKSVTTGTEAHTAAPNAITKPSPQARPVFSADTLMRSFEQKMPLRGEIISVRDTVVEVKKSEVVFKSAGNDKVVCELEKSKSPAASLKGRVLTVVGRVKGRGLLGNVTLEDCAIQ